MQLKLNSLTRPAIVAGIVIMIAWLSTMIFLVKGHRDSTNIPTDELQAGEFFGSVSTAQKWQDIEEWMLVMQVNPETKQARPVGASHTAIRRMDEQTTSGAVYMAEFALQAKLSPLLPTGSVKGVALLDKESALTSFSLEGQLGALRMSTVGAVVDDHLLVQITQPNATNHIKRHLTQPVSFGEVLRPSLSRHMKIETGEKMSSPVIDPLTGATRGKVIVEIGRQEVIELGGEKVQAFRVTTSIGDVETLMWIDEEGKTLRRNLVNNLRMDRTDRKSALKQAPQLEEPLIAQELVISDFDNVSADDGATGQRQSLGVLGLILQ